VTSFLAAITRLEPGSTGFQRKIGDVTSIGEREIRAIAELSGRFTDHALGGPLEDTAPVAHGLAELREAVEQLNPSAHRLTRRSARRSFGLLRRRDALERYFDTYAESEEHIRELVGALRDGRSELEQSNAVVAQEQRSLSTLRETLHQYARLAQRLDEEVEAAAAAIATTDPARSRLLVDDALFPIRQRRQDILTQLAVSGQALAALAILKAGNDQLIRAVATVTTTTVAALRTAVLAAQALTHDHRVAAQLHSVNELAAAVDSHAAALAEEPGAGEGAEIAALQRAWDQVSAALDEVEAHKRNLVEAVSAATRTHTI
jgi:uncharacterized protein YaaN involved in tellurite resistance